MATVVDKIGVEQKPSFGAVLRPRVDDCPIPQRSDWSGSTTKLPINLAKCQRCSYARLAHKFGEVRCTHQDAQRDEARPDRPASATIPHRPPGYAKEHAKWLKQLDRLDADEKYPSLHKSLIPEETYIGPTEPVAAILYVRDLAVVEKSSERYRSVISDGGWQKPRMAIRLKGLRSVCPSFKAKPFLVWDGKAFTHETSRGMFQLFRSGQDGLGDLPVGAVVLVEFKTKHDAERGQ